MFDNFFFENRAVYEIMWKNNVHPGRTLMAIWRMRTVCWIPKVANTHSEYVILLFHYNSGHTKAAEYHLRLHYLSCFISTFSLLKLQLQWVRTFDSQLSIRHLKNVLKKEICLTFRNLASYIQDERKITLQMPHFIFIQQISVLYILNTLYNLHFFSSKCHLFHNAILFGFCITHILNTGCSKI